MRALIEQRAHLAHVAGDVRLDERGFCQAATSVRR
jgi:hypothetical protein